MKKGIGWFKPVHAFVIFCTYVRTWIYTANFEEPSNTKIAPCYHALGMPGLNVSSCNHLIGPLLERIFSACYFQLCRCMWPPFFTSAFYTSVEGSTKTFLRTKHFVEVFISGNREAVDAIHRCSKPSGCVWNSFESHR